MSSAIQCLCGDEIEDGVTCPNCDRTPEEQNEEYLPETTPKKTMGSVPAPKPRKTGSSWSRRPGTTKAGDRVKSAYRRSDRGDGNVSRDLGFSNFD